MSCKEKKPFSNRPKADFLVVNIVTLRIIVAAVGRLITDVLMDVDGFFTKLVAFAKELNTEDQRSLSEQLTEEELAVFDILTNPEIEMSAKERSQVKLVARTLLQNLKQAKLVLDWRKKLQSRADVYATVKTILDDLPRTFTPDLYQQKCDTVYQHVFDNYAGEGISVYGAA